MKFIKALFKHRPNNNQNIFNFSKLPFDLQMYILLISNDWKTSLNLIFTSKKLYQHARDNRLILDLITRNATISSKCERKFILTNISVPNKPIALYQNSFRNISCEIIPTASIATNIEFDCSYSNDMKTSPPKSLPVKYNYIQFACSYSNDMKTSPPKSLPAKYSYLETHRLSHNCIATEFFNCVNVQEIEHSTCQSYWRAKCYLTSKSLSRLLHILHHNKMILTQDFAILFREYLVRKRKMTLLASTALSQYNQKLLT